jgi:hypothetical protein
MFARGAACSVREPEHSGGRFPVWAWPQPDRQPEGRRSGGVRGFRVEPESKTPNQALERMPGSAGASRL